MKSYWYITYVNSKGYNSARLRLNSLFFSPLKVERELSKLENCKSVLLYHARISKKDYYSPNTQNLKGYEPSKI